MSKMGNTTKILLFGLGMVIFVLMSYLIIIKPLQSNHTKLMLTQEQLQGEKKYYDSLKDASDNTSGEIDQLNSEITDVENQFLPYLNTECIEQYVMAMFEENGCPYLKSIESESIVTNDVALPDGTFSSERLVQRRITVTYSTTDGYCIPQYNTVPDNNELTLESASSPTFTQFFLVSNLAFSYKSVVLFICSSIFELTLDKYPDINSIDDATKTFS